MQCKVTPSGCSTQFSSLSNGWRVVDMCSNDSVNGNWDCVLPKDDYYNNGNSGRARKKCLKVTCPSNYPGGSANCGFCGAASVTGDTISYVKGYSAPSPPPPSPPPPSPSPPPPSPPPSTSSTPTPTTGDCECTCCTGNYCSSSVVGYLNAGSSSSCTSDACRTTFPSSCPASGSSGSVMSTYSSSSSTPSPSSSSSGISLNSLLGLISTIFVTIFKA